MSPHPILAGAYLTLRDAAAWTPADTRELARFIATLHGPGADNVVTALSAVLRRVAETLPAAADLGAQDRSLIATHLLAASECLGLAGEHLDLAHQATGWWES